jgi:hypothetical protein
MQRPAIRVLTVLIALCGLASWVACGPEVGSDAWCEKMRETSKGDWTANEAADFARHCLLD